MIMMLSNVCRKAGVTGAEGQCQPVHIYSAETKPLPDRDLCVNKKKRLAQKIFGDELTNICYKPPEERFKSGIISVRSACAARFHHVMVMLLLLLLLLEDLLLLRMLLLLMLLQLLLLMYAASILDLLLLYPKIANIITAGR